MNEDRHNLNADKLAGIRLPFAGRHLTTLFLVAAGGLAFAAANCLLLENAWHRFWSAYLVAFAFILSISLGSLFFVLVQHLMRAGWSVVVRRIAEVFACNLIVVAVLFLPIAWTVFQHDDAIYVWADQDSTAHESRTVDIDLGDQAINVSSVSAVGLIEKDGDISPNQVIQTLTADGRSDESHLAVSGHVDQQPQKPYLNNSRFLTAWIMYFCVWIGIAGFYFHSSVRQDKSQSVALTRRMEWCSGVSMLLFGFALTYAAFDLLMSLDPTWFSTIFGVYFFAGCAVAGIAAILLTILVLRRFGVAPDVFSEEVQRDLGRLLFAFVFFWAYIAFSQYMLLWYANVPETTSWLVRRGMSTATGYTNSWSWLAIGLLLAHFVIPFVAIMSRHVKSNSTAMIVWTIWLLVIHFFDLYWIVIPQRNPQFTISFVEIGTLLALLSTYLVAAVFIASRNGLIPIGDPRLEESIHRHESY